MNNGLRQQHISHKFDDELQNVLSEVLAMGGMAEQQLAMALGALIDGDTSMGTDVIDNEAKMNAYEVSIDKECIDILARRQPAAMDLRLIMAMTKIVTDLERIGDEAQKIAKRASELTENYGVPKTYHASIKDMGALSTQMLHDALDAFARMDSKSALSVANMELESDDQHNVITRQLITYMMEYTGNISNTLSAARVVRALERIGDHARNICEHIIYFVEGKDVRHITLEQMKKEIDDED